MKKEELPELRKLLLNAAVFVIIMLSVDWIAGMAIKTYVSRFDIVSQSNMETAIFKKADILIFGASQAEVGLNPMIITDKTSLVAVNLAQSSSNVTYNFIILKEYLKHHKPRFLINVVTAIDLMDRPKILQVTQRLRHLYGSDAGIDSVLSAVTPKAKFSLFFSLYRYNRLLLDIIRNRKIGNVKDSFRPYAVDNGKYVDSLYNIYKGHIKEENQRALKSVASIKNEGISYTYLLKLIDLCRDEKIELFLVFCPSYHGEDLALNLTPVPEYFKRIPEDDYIHFVHVSHHKYPYLKSKLLFKDMAHMNSAGADSLSKIIASYIIREM